VAWSDYLAEAPGLCIYAQRRPSGPVGAALDELHRAGGIESAPLVFSYDELELTITARVMRASGNRVDPMLSQAVGWTLESVSPSAEARAKALTSLRLTEAVLGIVAQPPILTASDPRLGHVIAVLAETEGLLFNGLRLRGADGVDLAEAPRR
jgi:hypothetical protein